MKKDFENGNGVRQLQARFVKREFTAPPGHPFTVISQELSPVDPTPEGYDPYNKPAPQPGDLDPDHPG